MTTIVFENLEEFRNREDKTINGVTQEFADAHPGWDAELGNTGCWNCDSCYSCGTCSDCRACRDCYACQDCSDCSRCYHRSAICKEVDFSVKSPVIPNIHQEVREAVESAPDALDMRCWHVCETTHCRAGWVVTLAGAEGRRLEEKTSTEFAAMRIYSASSRIRVSPVRFYDDRDAAMRDIIRCAEEEAALADPT